MAATKGGFQHYLRKEINEQPQAWIDTLSGRAAAGSSAVRFEGELLPAGGPAAIGRIVMVSAGASWITSLMGKFMIEELAAMPAEVDYSAEFRYRRPPIDDAHDDHRGVAVGRDRRHSRRDGRRARARMPSARDHQHRRFVDRAQGRRAVVHALRSRNKRHHHQMLSDPARGLLSVRDPSGAARLGRLSEREVNAMLQPALAIPAQIKDVLEKRARISSRSRANTARRATSSILGRGINYPVALEGALKLKEISYIHAEGYSAGEMKHGPIALIDEKMPVVVIIPYDDVFEKTLSNLRKSNRATAGSSR